ncbi:oxygenase MpaB family protein [Nocardia asiatica]|uniref:oxygenase MpaB family protein n=1 Tax=Nocardia asiatica TaxID=209252 RepID=UPI0012F957CE|nr:oxygenase MpaB family protein [Nocardia asiatica]
MEHGIDSVPDAPIELREFFAAVDTVPYWVDHDRLDRGCRVIGRTGIVGFMALSMGALMGGYFAARVAKTLVGTGDLERMAPRRLAETVAWHSAVTAPGGLNRFADGFKQTMRVRLMHALVRAGMLRRPDWDFDAWDHPLNNSQLAGTAMLFALAHLSGCQALGLHFTRDERADVYHLWRYVGFLLGVEGQILPADEADGWRLFWLQASYEFDQPDGDCVRLAQALAGAVGPLMVGERAGRLPQVTREAVTGVMCAYARLILGNANADQLQLPDQKLFQALVLGAAVSLKAAEYPRRLLPGATRWAEFVGRRCQLALTDRMMCTAAPRCRPSSTGRSSS